MKEIFKALYYAAQSHKDLRRKIDDSSLLTQKHIAIHELLPYNWKPSITPCQ